MRKVEIALNGEPTNVESGFTKMSDLYERLSIDSSGV